MSLKVVLHCKQQISIIFLFSRVLLAAIHFNENTDRQQLETKDGEKRWQISYIKYKQTGEVKPIKSKSTYG